MIRRITSFLLAVLLLITTAYAEGVVYTERKSKSDEAWLWDELSKHSPSDVITAAVLSYFWRESQYRSDSISGWATIQREQNWDICKTVRKKTDKGLKDGSSRKYFIGMVQECGGYGLGQWYSISYVKDLYAFASDYFSTADYRSSIGDAKMQCAFMFHSLKKNKRLWKRLKKCDDPEIAGRFIAVYYDGTEDGAPYMGYKARVLYDKYGGKT